MVGANIRRLGATECPGLSEICRHAATKSETTATGRRSAGSRNDTSSFRESSEFSRAHSGRTGHDDVVVLLLLFPPMAGGSRYSNMQELLRWCASLLTILPGIVIAARVRPLWTGWAFVALTAGALTWIVVASMARDYALLAQNIAITVINCLGIYRWLIWKGQA